MKYPAGLISLTGALALLLAGCASCPCRTGNAEPGKRGPATGAADVKGSSKTGATVTGEVPFSQGTMGAETDNVSKQTPPDESPRVIPLHRGPPPVELPSPEKK